MRPSGSVIVVSVPARTRAFARRGSPRFRRGCTLRKTIGVVLLAILGGCGRPDLEVEPKKDSVSVARDRVSVGSQVEAGTTPLVVNRDVPIDAYFEFLDSLMAQVPSLLALPRAEHVLVRANPWLIDRLEETDYYRLAAKGVQSLDPRAEVVLRSGDTLWVPNEPLIQAMADTLDATVLDINIPEFRLRIREFGETRHSFPVRVGRDERRFLAMAGREVDLRTRTGSGSIVRIEKDPVYQNPVDNHRYRTTRRDDGVVTGLPRIPFLEPELDGQRHGQLIHPTTNPRTLGGATSNGCIGTGEAAAWRIYYSAPLGTRIVIRYDLEPGKTEGDSIPLPDVYRRGSRQ